MNDDDRSTNDMGRNFGPVIGFAIGALVGGSLALLLAPASGARTRRRIGNAARQFGQDTLSTLEDARHGLDGARESVTDAATGLGHDVKAALDAGREAFRHDGKPADARPGSRVPQTLHTPPANTP